MTRLERIIFPAAWAALSQSLGCFSPPHGHAASLQTSITTWRPRLSFSTAAKIEYAEIRRNPEKLPELLSIFKAAGVELSYEADAVTVRVGPNVLEVLYEQHGLAWPIEPKLS